MEASIRFKTNQGKPWLVTKTFNDRRHMQNFINYIERSKGYVFDEVWV